jgi:hypothetical protein
MRVHLGYVEIDDQNYRQFQNIALFSREILDTEANEIVCDGFLGGFNATELQQVLGIICKKIRLNGELVIKDLDIDLVAKNLNRQEMSVADMNSHVFKSRSLKSFLTLEDVERIIPDDFQVSGKGFDENMCEFIIKARRLK